MTRNYSWEMMAAGQEEVITSNTDSDDSSTRNHENENDWTDGNVQDDDGVLRNDDDDNGVLANHETTNWSVADTTKSKYNKTTTMTTLESVDRKHFGTEDRKPTEELEKESVVTDNGLDGSSIQQLQCWPIGGLRGFLLFIAIIIMTAVLSSLVTVHLCSNIMTTTRQEVVQGFDCCESPCVMDSTLQQCAVNDESPGTSTGQEQFEDVAEGGAEDPAKDKMQGQREGSGHANPSDIAIIVMTAVLSSLVTVHLCSNIMTTTRQEVVQGFDCCESPCVMDSTLQQCAVNDESPGTSTGQDQFEDVPEGGAEDPQFEDVPEGGAEDPQFEDVPEGGAEDPQFEDVPEGGAEDPAKDEMQGQPEASAHANPSDIHYDQAMNSFTQVFQDSQKFLHKIASAGMADAGDLLVDLAVDKWEYWVRMVQDSKRWSMTNLQRWVRGFFNPRHRIMELEKVMMLILDEFNDLLLRSTNQLTFQEHSSAEVTKTVVLVLPSEVEFYLKFLTLQVNSAPVAKALWQRQNRTLQSQSLDAAPRALAGAFDKLSGLANRLVEDMHFQELGRVLDLWPGGQTSTMIRSFGLLPSSTDREIRLLQESAKTFPVYEDLRRQAREALLIIRNRIESMSFHNVPGHVNEHDIIVFYDQVATTIKAATQASRLQDHVKKDDWESLSALAQDKVLQETKTMASRLDQMIQGFPKSDADFSKIHVSLLHLTCMSKAFAVVDNSLVGNAEFYIDDATRSFVSKLEESSLHKEIVIASLARRVMLLKKASAQISVWREPIDGCINKLIAKSSASSRDSGKFLIDLFWEIDSIEGDDAVIAAQLLSEHKCFESGKHAIFNSVTAQQTIGYVMNRLGLQEPCFELLKHMYESFELTYESLVNDSLFALRNPSKKRERLDYMVSMAHRTARDLERGYTEQVSMMTAHIFAYWTLKSTDMFSASAISQGGGTCFLMKPHPAQVVAIFLMLNSCGDDITTDQEQLGGHLVEVKTGEGKSIILGVSAIVLALFNSEVQCVCYSKYLSNRDYADFASMFKDFGVDDLIQYGTLRDLAVQNAFGKDVVNVVVQHLRFQPDKKHNYTRSSLMEAAGVGRLKVLLIDEVDVFFDSEIYGNLFRPITGISDTDIKALIMLIWRTRGETDAVRDKMKAVLEGFAVDARDLVKIELQAMIKDAEIVRSGGHKYEVVDGKIGYKYFDGITSRSFSRYLTVFAYIKESEEGNIEEDDIQDQLKIWIRFGAVSFAEVPLNHDMILGVTGTLSSLREEEKNVLETTYGIHQFSYLPSVYGANKLRFAGDSEQGESCLVVVELRERRHC